jgi:[acyl-carrier-protein] S-malonyltransferase
MIGLLFGGQGTETPRMGLDLAAAFAPAAELLDHASDLLRSDARALIARGEYRRTSIVQPLLTAVGLGAWLKIGRTESVVAGHSLGEVAAWAASGAISARDAVALAVVRGRLMEREADRHPGGMISVSTADVDAVIAIGKRHGSVVLAAHNAPGEWTLSGDKTALDAIAAAHAATRLPVSGAWHSPAMAGAVDELHKAARAIATREPSRAWIVNRTGEAFTGDAADVLAGQLVRPISWAKTIATMVARGVDHFVILGPGKQLRGLVRKNTKVRVSIVETIAEIEALA